MLAKTARRCHRPTSERLTKQETSSFLLRFSTFRQFMIFGGEQIKQMGRKNVKVQTSLIEIELFTDMVGI